jgi:hypothetical protein
MNDVSQVEVRQRSSNGLGTASLVLGILACLICWIPFLGMLAIPVAIIGIILAAIGFLLGIFRKSSKGGAIAGGITCLLAIIISVSVTGKTAAVITESMAKSDKTIQNEQRGAVAPHQPVAPINMSAVPAPQVPAPVSPSRAPVVEWGTYEAEKYFVQGDMAVKIQSLTIGKTPLVSAIGRDKEGTSKDELLMISIMVKNQSEGKKVDYQSWAGERISFASDFAKLSDNFDNTYKRVSFGGMNKPKGQLERESIYPGKEVSDVLVFEVPVEKASELKLELPAKNFGGDGFLRIKIPASVISRH